MECLRPITSLARHFSEVQLVLPSGQTASATRVENSMRVCGYSRSSTAIERPDLFTGDVGSIPIGSVNLDGPLSLGYR
jgi:hypothetical protein